MFWKDLSDAKEKYLKAQESKGDTATSKRKSVQQTSSQRLITTYSSWLYSYYRIFSEFHQWINYFHLPYTSLLSVSNRVVLYFKFLLFFFYFRKTKSPVSIKLKSLFLPKPLISKMISQILSTVKKVHWVSLL